jgi:hypothetical protein
VKNVVCLIEVPVAHFFGAFREGMLQEFCVGNIKLCPKMAVELFGKCEDVNKLSQTDSQYGRLEFRPKFEKYNTVVI